MHKIFCSRRKASILLEEKNKYYIDIHDYLVFLKNGKEFLWLSESDGYNQIYLYDMNGKLKKQITSEKNEVTEFYGFDEAENILYYQSAENDGLDRKIYCIKKDGTNKRELKGLCLI